MLCVAEFEIAFGQGVIAYYPDDCTFVATCMCGLHVEAGAGECQHVRTARSGRAKAQGRPLGFLAAWLEDREHPTRGEHVSMRSYSRAIRKAARIRLRAVAPELFARERPMEGGDDDEEPFRCP